MTITLWEIVAHQAQQPHWKLEQVVQFIEAMLQQQKVTIRKQEAYNE